MATNPSSMERIAPGLATVTAPPGGVPRGGQPGSAGPGVTADKVPEIADGGTMYEGILSPESAATGSSTTGRAEATGSALAERCEMSGDEQSDPATRNGAGAGGPLGERDTLLVDRVGRPTVRQRLRTTLELIRANPTGRIALKGFVSVAGAIVVVIGIILIPLPGPGWLLVIAGLGIWAIEFHWAKRLLGFTRRHVQGWTRWVARQSWPIRIALGGVGLVFVIGVATVSLKYGLGIDLVARLLAYLATN